MLDNVLGIATRQNPLAFWQAYYVKDKLMAGHPGLVVKLVPMVTHGDVIFDTPLAKVGRKGLFVEELEVALLGSRADIAVHSMKDVPAEFSQDLRLVTVCEREDPRDAFVPNTYDSLDALLTGSIVGTSNLRHQCQLTERRPDLITRFLRGNVGIHLNKLDSSKYDAVILAVAGLKRLGLKSHIHAALPPKISLPAIGQDAVGIRRRLDNARTRELLTALNHHETALHAIAERTMNTHLEGGCQVPIGSYAEPIDGEIWLRTLIGAPDGSQTIRGEHRGTPQDAEQMGISLAEELLSSGARGILAEIYDGDVPT